MIAVRPLDDAGLDAAGVIDVSEEGDVVYRIADGELRAVQEILAESTFRPARWYYLKRAYPAVIDRCEEIMMKYPDFSNMDQVLFALAESTNEAEASLAMERAQHLLTEFNLDERANRLETRQDRSLEMVKLTLYLSRLAIDTVTNEIVKILASH